MNKHWEHYCGATCKENGKLHPFMTYPTFHTQYRLRTMVVNNTQFIHFEGTRKAWENGELWFPIQLLEGRVLQ